jgi:hypothetical protein
MLNTDQTPITIEQAIAQLKKEGIKLDHHEAQAVLKLMNLMADIYLSGDLVL